MNHSIIVVQRIAIAAIRVHRQRTISPGKRRANHTSIYAKGERRHRRTIRTLRVGNTVCVVGVGDIGTGNDVTVSYRGAIFSNAVYVGACRWHIVDNIDNQRASCRVTVLIRDHHSKIIKGRVTRGVSRQRVAVTNCAIGDAGHGQYADTASKALTHKSYSLTIECHRGGPIGRSEGE